jgi:glycosyltransferase involved in cell wall biosynthesis
LNPVVIIPTYISSSRRRTSAKGIVSSYDHTTNINELGELERCLTSLCNVDNMGLIVVLVAADRSIEAEALQKVRSIARNYPDLNIITIGQPELEIIQQQMASLNIEQVNNEIGLRGYGAIRNLGLLLASSLGFDAAIFLDDDEIIDDPDFIEKATYGIGKLTKNGIPILVKTGYYINDQGSYLSKWEDKWYNRFWQQGRAFNEWIESALAGPRLSRSNHVCGGCLVVHKEAFMRVPFDPWIPRGEDLDYMLNLRMYGGDIWFDNQWSLRHLPPETKSEGNRFRQDIFRWLYEYAKLEYSHSLIDLQKITAKSLEPYPGPFLERGLRRRIAITAWLRSLVRPDKKAYRRAAKTARGEGIRYAQDNCTNYFAFQQIWPQIMERLNSNQELAQRLIQSALPSAK